ncbi:MAG: aminoacyl--tRNA ligase-related protein [Acidobacteriota bacterium]
MPYLSEEIVSHSFSEDGRFLNLEIASANRIDAIRALAKEFVEENLRGHRPVPAEAIFRHRTTSPHRTPVWEELTRAGLLFSEGSGQVALLGDACRIAERLSALFAEIARSPFEAEPHQYSTLLSVDALNRCHYFSSFPHHVTFAPHVREDLGAIQELSAQSQRPKDRAFFDLLSPPEVVLSPAVCFHTYALLADRTLSRPMTVTAKGRCFRYESKNLSGLERSWDFTMQEIVFIGEADWVEERRERAIREVGELVERLDLDAWVETANDHFFATNFVAKRYHQLMTRAKFELRLGLPYNGSSLAAASFNIHDDFFGRSFGIRLGDGFARTGCLGFGVERWVWALFSQFGPRPEQWPERVRRVLVP